MTGILAPGRRAPRHPPFERARSGESSPDRGIDATAREADLNSRTPATRLVGGQHQCVARSSSQSLPPRSSPPPLRRRQHLLRRLRRAVLRLCRAAGEQQGPRRLRHPLDDPSPRRHQRPRRRLDRVGGTTDGPHGMAEWIQTGLAAFAAQDTSQIYYEVTVAGGQPHYTELAANVGDGVSYHLSVLQMAHRASWWRIWVNGKPVSPPIDPPAAPTTGIRRRSPRTGTAAPAPATATPIASRTSRSRCRTAASGGRSS